MEDFVRLSYVDLGLGNYNCGVESDDVQWRLDGDSLHFNFVANHGGGDQIALNAMFEAKPWQKAEEWSTGLPPNGVWQVELTADDFVQMGVLRSVAEAEWAGTYTLTLKDGKSVGVWKGLQGQTGKCQANYEVVENFVRFTYYTDTDECLGEVDDLQWRLDEEGLHFHVLDVKNAPLKEIKAYLEAKPWQKVEEWSPGLPPSGIWQVELNAEDFMRMGVMQSKANQMAGTYTWTLQDGNYILLWEDGAGQSGNCIGTFAVVDDFVRLTSTTDDCPGEVEDFRWRLDNDGLHVHLLATKNIPFVEMKANFEAKPWQKIADP
jgi:hypothetical protein